MLGSCGVDWLGSDPTVVGAAAGGPVSTGEGAAWGAGVATGLAFVAGAWTWLVTGWAGAGLEEAGPAGAIAGAAAAVGTAGAAGPAGWA